MSFEKSMKFEKNEKDIYAEEKNGENIGTEA